MCDSNIGLYFVQQKKKKKNIEFVLIKEYAFLIIGSNCAESLKLIFDNFLLTEVFLLLLLAKP